MRVREHRASMPRTFRRLVSTPASSSLPRSRAPAHRVDRPTPFRRLSRYPVAECRPRARCSALTLAVACRVRLARCAFLRSLPPSLLSPPCASPHHFPLSPPCSDPAPPSRAPPSPPRLPCASPVRPLRLPRPGALPPLSDLPPRLPPCASLSSARSPPLSFPPSLVCCCCLRVSPPPPSSPFLLLPAPSSPPRLPGPRCPPPSSQQLPPCPCVPRPPVRCPRSFLSAPTSTTGRGCNQLTMPVQRSPRAPTSRTCSPPSRRPTSRRAVICEPDRRLRPTTPCDATAPTRLRGISIS